MAIFVYAWLNQKQDLPMFILIAQHKKQNCWN